MCKCGECAYFKAWNGKKKGDCVVKRERMWLGDKATKIVDSSNNACKQWERK